MKKYLILAPVIATMMLAGCGLSTKDNEVVNRDYTTVAIEDTDDTTADADTETYENDTTAEAEESVEYDTTVADTKEETDAATTAAANEPVANVTGDTFAYKIHDGLIDLDSDKGPYYIISLSTMEVVDCTSKGAKVVSYDKDGSTLTLVLYSNEYPVNSEYVIDLSDSTCDPVTSQSISGDTLNFTTQNGINYVINLSTKKLVSCSDSKGKLVKCSKSGNTWSVTVYSGSVPVDMTYTFEA